MKGRIIKKLEDQIKTLTKTIEKSKILLRDFLFIFFFKYRFGCSVCV